MLLYFYTVFLYCTLSTNFIIINNKLMCCDNNNRLQGIVGAGVPTSKEPVGLCRSDGKIITLYYITLRLFIVT